jgi:hypothetical protein
MNDHQWCRMMSGGGAHGRRARILARGFVAVGLLLVAACPHDPLVVRNVYPGLVAVRAPEGELTRVLFSADGMPAQQGFLYTAMYDAGVAGQNASLARAAATAEEARTKVGEVLYAIDPEIAPSWPAKNSGIAEVWAGSGYGLRRSIPRMIDDIRAALDRGSASAALRNYGPRAIQCAENALQGTERVRVLSEQVLAATTDAALDPILRQLDEAATALNNGVPSPDGQGCGLQQTFLYLEQVDIYSPYGGV